MNTNLQNDFQNSKTSTNHSLWLSWPFIVLICIVFWPVGLFLIWKRTTMDRKSALLSGKSIYVLGWACLAIVFLGLFVCFSKGFKSDDISTIIFFLLAGVGLISLGKKLKNKADISKKYISIVVNDRIIDIDNIAAAIPTSYENATKDLQDMINKGFFEGAYLNEAGRQIVLPKRHEESSHNDSNGTEQIKMQVVTCSGCGAQNSIAAGTVGECEFCGSKIQA